VNKTGVYNTELVYVKNLVGSIEARITLSGSSRVEFLQDLDQGHKMAQIEYLTDSLPAVST
jgi:hypothetical protein